MIGYVRDQRGVTLVELLTAVTILAILLTASAVLYTSIVKIDARTKLTEEIQREGDAVVSHMSQNFRDAVAVDTAGSNFSTQPNSIRFRLADGNYRRYYVSSDQLHFVSESGNDQLLQQPGTTVEELSFKVGSDTTGLQVITATISLAREKDGASETLEFNSTVNTRPQ